jgi:hypothetical protein
VPTGILKMFKADKGFGFIKLTAVPTYSYICPRLSKADSTSFRRACGCALTLKQTERRASPALQTCGCCSSLEAVPDADFPCLYCGYGRLTEDSCHVDVACVSAQ